MLRKAILVVAGAMAILWGCTRVEVLRFSVIVSLQVVPPAAARTILPDASLDPVAFHVWGSGPDGESFDVETSDSQFVVEDLLVGTWEIGADGSNTDGVRIVTGSTSVELSAATTQIALHLVPCNGDGSIHLLMSWDPLSVLSPSIAVSLQAGSGELYQPGVTISSGQGSLTQTLAAGFYTLTATLCDGETPVAGLAEAVLIAATVETTAEVVFDVDAGSLGATISLSVTPPEPLQLSISAPVAPYLVGTEIQLSATVGGGGEGSQSAWYVDGRQVASGDSVVMSLVKEGVLRVDVVAFTEDYLRAGSATLDLPVIDPVLYDGMVYVGSWFDGTDGVNGLDGARSVVCPPGSQQMLVAGYTDDAIAVFLTSGGTGAIQFTGMHRDGEFGPLDGVEELANSPDGVDLAAAVYGSDAVLWMKRSEATGTISLVNVFTGAIEADLQLDGPSSVAFGPRGELLYAAAKENDRILVLRCDETAASLALVQTAGQDEAESGILTAPQRVAVTPDGTQLFATGWGSDTLLVYDIDQTIGTLSFRQHFVDGESGVDGLNGPCGIAFSSDGGYAYIAGYYDNSVSLFRRDPVSSNWQFVALWTNGTGGATGFKYAWQPILSPDGQSLYVCGSGDDSVVFLNRDPVSGLLTWLATASNNVDGVCGLDGVRSGWPSPDGRFLYVVSSNDGAVVLFRRVE